MKIKVKVVRKITYKNGWGMFGCIPINKDDYNNIKLNKKYGSFTIKGKMIELVEGEEYTVEVGDLTRETGKDGNVYEFYPIIDVEVPRNTSYQTQYQFLKVIMTDNQYKAFCKVYPISQKIKVIDKIKNGEIKLSNIKGISISGAERILRDIYENEDIIHLINKLAPLGVTYESARKIASSFGSAHIAVQEINRSIYNLCKVKGYGFKTVDKYALRGGEGKESFKRIEACINYIIHEESKDGHCWTDIQEIKEQAIKLLDIDRIHIDQFFNELHKHDSNILVTDSNQVTSQYYYNQEVEVFNHLKRINDNYKLNINTENLEQYIKELEDNLNIKYTEEQTETILESFKYGIFTINGKAGSGKSTLLKAVTEICNKLNLSYIAIALSGRATQILNEKGINSATIHRTLCYKGEEFLFNEKCKLHYDVIILDEASMVNVSLWNSLVKAIKDGAKLIIVGDSGQLSGIGYGDVLRDLLQTKYFNGKELTQIHRQAQDSGIIEVASKVREGEQITSYNWEITKQYGKNSDMFLFTYKDNDSLFINAKKVIESRMNVIKENEIMNFQILTSIREKGKLSAVNLNKYCQKIYNDLNKPYISNSIYDFREGDKVIVSGNTYGIYLYETIDNYKIRNPITEITEDEYGNKNTQPKLFNLFNGTLGIIEKIVKDNFEESLLIKFDGLNGYVNLNKEQLKDLDLAYAVTIHKYQGSSSENVLFLLDFGAFNLLSKQLVYTAITRASKKCVVMALNNALYKAIKTDASNNRRTFLKQLMQQELSNQN